MLFSQKGLTGRTATLGRRACGCLPSGRGRHRGPFARRHAGALRRCPARAAALLLVTLLVLSLPGGTVRAEDPPSSIPVTYSQVITFAMDAPGNMPEPWDHGAEVTGPLGLNRVGAWVKVGALPYSFRFPVRVTISYDLAQAYPGNTFPVKVTITPEDGARIRSLYGLDFGLKFESRANMFLSWQEVWSSPNMDFCVNIDHTARTPFNGQEVIGTDSVQFADITEWISLAGDAASGGESGGSGGGSGWDDVAMEFVPSINLNLNGGLKVIGRYVEGKLMATGAASGWTDTLSWYGAGQENEKVVQVKVPQEARPGSLIEFSVCELEYHFDVQKGIGLELAALGMTAGFPMWWHSTEPDWETHYFSPSDGHGGVTLPIRVQNSPWELGITNVFWTDQDHPDTQYMSDGDFYLTAGAGKTVQFGIRVANLGWQPLAHLASDTRPVARMYFDDTDMGTVRVCDTGGFPLGGLEQVITSPSWSVTMTPGTHLVGFQLDPDGKLYDDSWNNAMWFQFWVYGSQGDLIGEISQAGTNGTPVPLSEIERVVLDGGTRQYVANLSTDQFGNTWYSFRDVWAETVGSGGPIGYNLTVITKNGSSFANKTVAVTVPANDCGTMDVALDQAAVVTGTVRDTSDNPLPGATVSLFSGSPALTADDGTYRIGKLRPGTYDIRAEHQKCFSQGKTGVVLSPGDNVVDFTLNPYYGNLGVQINGGAPHTPTPDVVVNFTGRPDYAAPVAVRLSEDEATLGQAAEPAYPQNDRLPFTLSDGEGTKTVYVQFKAPDGWWSDPVSDTIVLDGTGPSGTVTIEDPEQDGRTDTPQVNLFLSATDVSGVTEVEVSNDAVHWWRVPLSGGSEVSTQVPWTLPGGGTQTVHARYVDEWGNVGEEVTDSIEVDYPDALVINGGAAYTNSVTLTCQLVPGGVPVAEQTQVYSGGTFGKTSGDTVYPYRVAQPFSLTESKLVSGVDLALTRTDTCARDVHVAVYGSLDGPALAAATIAAVTVPSPAEADWVTASFSQPLSLSAGNYYLVVETTSSPDNNYVLWGTMGGYTPSDYVWSYENGAWQQCCAWGALGYRVHACPPYMRISLDGTFDDESWVDYEPVSQVTIGGQGEQTVYVQFGDAGQSVTGQASARIFVDTVAPTAALAVRDYTPGTYCPSRTLTLDLTAADEAGGSGLEAMRLSYGGAPGQWEPVRGQAAAGDPVTVATQVNLPADGQYTFSLEVRDRAGNVASTSQTVLVDTAGPVASVCINGGKDYTNNRLVSITVQAEDSPAGVQDVRLSCGPVRSAWLQPAAANCQWILPDSEGYHIFQAEVRDNAGNITMVEDTIILTHVRPYPRPQPGWVDIVPDGYATALPVTVRWTAAEDPTGIDSYRVQVAEDFPVFTTDRVCYDTTIGGAVLELQLGGDVLDDQRVYYARVEATNNAGSTGGWGVSLVPLKVDLSPPVPPTVTGSLEAGESPGTIRAVLSWTPAPHISGCAGYSVVLDQQDDTVPDEVIDTTDTTFTSSDLASGTYYFFHIRAQDGAGHWSGTAHLPVSTPGVTVSPTMLIPYEGGESASYTVVLDGPPSEDVVIQVQPDTQLVASPGTLTFTPDNWDVAQTVTVTAADDQVVEGVHPGTITHSAASDDPAYDGIAVPDVHAQIQDNDCAGLVVSPVALTVTEGGTGQFTVRLASEPLADVTVAVTGDFQVSVNPSSLVFTAANWSTPQKVTVTGADDDAVDGSQAGTVSFSVASDDGDYSGIAVEPVAVTVEDDDTEQIPGDVDGSGAVDTTDLAIISACYGASPDQPGWTEACDVVSDGRIDIRDLVRSARQIRPVIP